MTSPSSSSSSSSSSSTQTHRQAPGVVNKSQYPNNNGVKPFDFKNSSGFTCWSCFSFAWQATLLAGLGSFLFGFNLALLNTCMKVINIEYDWCGGVPAYCECKLQQNFEAFISTAVFIGAAIGSMTGGRFLSLGRRVVLLMSMAIFTFGIVSSVVANFFSSMLWARLVVGYGVGLVSVVCPMYIAEMVPKDVRGTHGVLHQLMITVGIFNAVLMGLPFSKVPKMPAAMKLGLATFGNDAAKVSEYILRECNKEALSMYKDFCVYHLTTFDKLWWRVMLGIGIVPVILCAYLLMAVYKFDTPHYYVAKRQYDDAAALLEIINQKSDVGSELAEIEEAQQDSTKAQSEGLGLFRALSMPRYSLVIIVGCLLSAFQQLSGINVFIAQSNKLFEKAGMEGLAVTGFTVAMTGINVIMTFPSLYLIEKLGRKTLLCIGTVGQAVGVLPAALMYWINPTSTVTTWLAIVGGIVFIIFFAVAYGPVLWVYLFEIYPAEIRGAGAGAATAVNWVCGIVMVFVTNYIGNQIAYTLFSVMCVIAFCICLMLVRETKGRSLEDSPYMTQNVKSAA